MEDLLDLEIVDIKCRVCIRGLSDIKEKTENKIIPIMIGN